MDELEKKYGDIFRAITQAHIVMPRFEEDIASVYSIVVAAQIAEVLAKKINGDRFYLKASPASFQTLRGLITIDNPRLLHLQLPSNRREIFTI